MQNFPPKIPTKITDELLQQRRENRLVWPSLLSPDSHARLATFVRCAAIRIARLTFVGVGGLFHMDLRKLARVDRVCWKLAIGLAILSVSKVSMSVDDCPLIIDPPGTAQTQPQPQFSQKKKVFCTWCHHQIGIWWCIRWNIFAFSGCSTVEKGNLIQHPVMVVRGPWIIGRSTCTGETWVSPDSPNPHEPWVWPWIWTSRAVHLGQQAF